jgi:hypothetical protein
MPPLRGKSGQAMIETIIVMVFLLIAFFTISQFADNFRARLVTDYAAGRCARSRSVGLNDYMILKIARVATMSIAGENMLPDYATSPLSASEMIGRSGNYLASQYESQAHGVLDFELWRNNKTSVNTITGGEKITATVKQLRPQFFSLPSFLAKGKSNKKEDDEVNASIEASHSIEAHYPDYLN